MSNALTLLVPVLDGSNWNQFEEAMTSYLLSQGQSKQLSGTAPTVPRLATDASNQEVVNRAQNKLDDWLENDAKAMGNIRLRLSPAIVQLIKGKTTAKDIWEELKAAHSQMTLGNAYVEFKGMIDTRIPDDQAPGAAISKIAAHVERLDGFYALVNDYVHLMLLISKTPAYARHVATQYSISQKMVDISATTTNAADRPNPKEYGRQVIAAWEQRKMVTGHKPQGEASRVTAVKRKGNDPQFQQQQQLQRQQGQQSQPQQPQQDNGSRKNRRGRRGGKNQHSQNGGAHNHIAAPAFNDFVPPPPAPRDPKPTLESRLEGERPLTGDGNQYPRMRRALELSQALGVPKSFERIRVLEDVAEASERARASLTTTDPRVLPLEQRISAPEFVEGSSRPSKRVRLTPEPIDWASEVAKESDEERERAVSLGLTEDESLDVDLLDSIGYYGKEPADDDEVVED